MNKALSGSHNQHYQPGGWLKPPMPVTRLLSIIMAWRWLMASV